MNLFRLLCPIVFLFTAASLFAEVPTEWLEKWRKPTASERPLQIIHGYFGVNKDRWAHPYLAFDHFGDRGIDGGMRFLAEQCGLGGVVLNVSSYEYLRNEEEWRHCVDAVKAAKKYGLRVWIYDEDRYPSLAAGGLTLQGHPELECRELVYDADAAEPFTVRPSFEYTHASNNFAYIRRYPNLLNSKAVDRFLELTHEAYKKRLGPELFDYVEAFFTDEPSTNVLNTGLLGSRIRSFARVIDEPDPDKKILPMVVWADDFPELYKKKYGEDLISQRKSLFTGDTAEDRRIRRQFWSLVADRNVESYYRRIGKWCEKNSLASTGHGLWEEDLIGHVPLDGNKLRTLMEMHIPGMDLLGAYPGSILGRGWKAALFPASAAYASNRRLVMTETSDIDTYVAQKPRATVAAMQGAAAWQSLLGVTEFTLYFQVTDRSPSDYKAYCDYVGRLNAVLREATPENRVLLYYPIVDLQEEYIPTKDRLHVKDQSERAQTIVRSFDALGLYLLKHQTPFFTADAGLIQEAQTVSADGKPCFSIGNQHPGCIVLPRGVRLDDELDKKLKNFVQEGGRVFDASSRMPEEEAKELDAFFQTGGRPETLDPPSERIQLGRFRRDGRTILMLLNSGEAEYSGRLRSADFPAGDTIDVLDPATGGVVSLRSDQEGRLPFLLKPGCAVFLIDDGNTGP